MNRFLVFYFATILFAAGCADAASEPTSSSDGPQFRLLIHDKPTVEVDEVWVAFDGVTAHHETEGWLTVSDEAQSFDLLSLQDGLVEELGFTEMPAGVYSQVRLHLTDAWVIVDGTTHELKVPSGTQSGLKIGHQFILPECGTLTMTLDWDAGAHLVHNRGQGYILRPVIDVESVTVEGECDPCAVVEFDDPALEQEVRDAIAKPTGPITSEDVDSLRYINFNGAGVTSLEGVQCLTSLTSLNGWSNSVSDLTPLSGHPSLQSLQLGFNDISDLTPLQNLNLYLMRIPGNPISSLEPLSGMTNLRILNVGRSNVSDLQPLSGLSNLRRLDVGVSAVSDLTPLSGLTDLTHLYLRYNTVADVAPISGLTNLQNLDLQGNQITDVSPLAGLTQLELLNIGFNNVTDVSMLHRLTNLVHLYMGYNAIDDISALGTLTKLETLQFFANNVSDIGVVASMPNLDYLYASQNPFSDITALSGLSELRRVIIQYTNVSDLTPLAGRCDLTLLWVQSTNVTCPNQILDDLAACGVNVGTSCY